MSLFKRILMFAVGIFLILQVFRPEKNMSGDTVKDISTLYAVPADVQEILRTACYDCHSNSTVYPWYAEIQPVGFWLNHHVEEGKDEINFNEFVGYRIGRQFRKLHEVSEMIEKNEMPLSSYTLIHTNARLTEESKKKVIAWSNAIRDSIKAKYPPDSLAKPKRN